jgi:hypothetical protein
MIRKQKKYNVNNEKIQCVDNASERNIMKRLEIQYMPEEDFKET